MFTGIVEAVGKLKSIKTGRDGARVKIDVGNLDMSDVDLGDSIATNGVCLTVVEFSSKYFCADVSNESLSRTNIGNYKPGQVLNLEKAMLPTTRFGGHIVSGHVDALAEIVAIKSAGHSTDYFVSMAESIAPYIVEKGSVTIDGVSLTINSVNKDSFRLTIVPHTQQQTIISQYRVGSRVNLEVDVIARYVERLMSFRQTPEKSSSVSLSLLTKTGFIK